MLPPSAAGSLDKILELKLISSGVDVAQIPAAQCA